MVGDYEFTTRQPQLGTIEYDDFVQIHGKSSSNLS